MKKTILLVSFASAAVFCNISCNDSASSTEGKHTLSLENMDSSVSPGDNFYLYANGNWFRKNEIPPTESRIGAGLEMYNRTKERVKGILEESANANAAAGSIEQKVGDFYAAGMDSAAIEKAGYEPVKPFLQKIGDIKDAEGVLQFAAEQATYNNAMLIGGFVGADEKNSMKNIAVFYQPEQF